MNVKKISDYSKSLSAPSPEFGSNMANEARAVLMDSLLVDQTDNTFPYGTYNY